MDILIWDVFDVDECHALISIAPSHSKSLKASFRELCSTEPLTYKMWCYGITSTSHGCKKRFYCTFFYFEI